MEVKHIETGTTHNYHDEFNRNTIGIVDSNAILSSVRNDCLNGWDSRIIRSTTLGYAKLFAPEHVYTDIYNHLTKFADERVPYEQLRTVLEIGYLPIIRFVTISHLDPPDAEVLTIPDIDDRPTGQLAQLIAPVVVLSEDSDLIDPHFAEIDWRNISKAIAETAEAKADEQVSLQLMTLPFVGSAKLLKMFASRFKISPLLPGVAFGVLLGVGLRHALIDPTTGPKMKEVGTRFVNSYVERRKDIESKIQVIHASTYISRKAESSRQQVAFALSRADRPMLVTEVFNEIVQSSSGWKPSSLQEISRTLRDGSEFTLVGRRHWQFGSYLSPRT